MIYSFGEQPFIFLNIRLKCGISLNPTEKQIFAMDIEVFNKCLAATSMRYWHKKEEKLWRAVCLKNAQNAVSLIDATEAISFRVILSM